MDPHALADDAVGLLLPYLGFMAQSGLENIGGHLAETALEKVGQLFQRIKHQFAPDSYNSAILQGLSEEPTDPARQQILATVIANATAADSDFAKDLARLVSEAQAAGAPRTIIANSGAVAGGDITQIGRYVAGRDITIPPSQAPDS